MSLVSWSGSSPICFDGNGMWATQSASRARTSSRSCGRPHPDRFPPGDLPGVEAGLGRRRDVHPGQLQVGVVEDGPDRVAADVPGRPLDDAVGHESAGSSKWMPGMPSFHTCISSGIGWRPGYLVPTAGARTCDEKWWPGWIW